ncbi:angiotensinogen [Tiliqua scincoides]|uniref:angiotensinogen n=1 Tax=Tiliqua scincoides TaxID=71010 RepID=UPI00346313B1
MNSVANLLGVLVCIIAANCDRVYVHPFYLITFENSRGCEEVEARGQLEKTFSPISIESHITSPYKVDFRNESEELGVKPSGVNILKGNVYVLGARFYKELRDIHKGDNIFLSPSNIYESLLAFYLGASGQTARDLQSLLGFHTPSSDPNCTSKIDGRKVLSTLRVISGPLHPEEADGLAFSKHFYLFSAPDIHLYESFVYDLASPDINFYVRAVDFSNPRQAVEQINAFVGDKSTHGTKSLLTDIDPDTTLLFAAYTKFKATVKEASLLKELQEFWPSPDTKISVPMMRVMGTFEYKCDDDLSLSVIKIPISKDVFLLLLQPANSSYLSSAEAQYSLQPSSEWLQKLSPRQIRLTLPTISFESIYNLQEPLEMLKLPELLGNKANLTMLSDSNVTIGKIINQQCFELNPSRTDQDDNPSGQNEDAETLKITLSEPFLIAIYEEQSNTLLYFGRVTNPLKGV